MVRSLERRKEHVDGMIELAVFLFLSNALCKYFLPNIATKLLPVLALLLVMIKKRSPLIIKVTKIDRPFVVFSIFWLIGCIYSPGIVKGLGYVFSFSIALLFGVYIEGKNIDEKSIMRLLTIACFVMASFVIVQPVSPDLVSNINRLFSYKTEEYYVMQAWVRNGWYSGLFPDRAPAAFYCVVLMGAGLYYIYRNRNSLGTTFQRFFGFGIMIVGIYGILLTAKRGLLVGACLAAFVTYIVYRKSNNSSILKICIGVVGIVGAILLIFGNIDATHVMLIRFFDNDNIMTGRLEIYSNIYDNISSNLLFGTGTASAFSLLGIGGHNIYLTALMENGIIAFVIFIYALLNSLFLTIRTILRFGKVCQSRIPFMLFALYIQVFFIVYGMSGNPLYDNYILYFYLFAILIVKNSKETFLDGQMIEGE